MLMRSDGGTLTGGALGDTPTPRAPILVGRREGSGWRYAIMRGDGAPAAPLDPAITLRELLTPPPPPADR